tara:strand:+ start:1974 stop:2570 length:597 start_codon:yes stop_codon:yes gene_type:complete
MKKLLLLIAMLLLLTQAAVAKTSYCTQHNWDKTKEYFEKYQSKLNDRIGRYNELLETKKNMGYYSSSYSLDEFSKLWVTKEVAVKLAVMTKKDKMNAEIRSINTEKVKLKRLKRKFKTVKKYWSAIAESCYENDEYSNYKRGRDNMRDAIEHIEHIEHIGELIVKLDKIKAKFKSEIEFFNITKKAADDYNELMGHPL